MEQQINIRSEYIFVDFGLVRLSFLSSSTYPGPRPGPSLGPTLFPLFSRLCSAIAQFMSNLEAGVRATITCVEKA